MIHLLGDANRVLNLGTRRARTSLAGVLTSQPRRELCNANINININSLTTSTMPPELIPDDEEYASEEDSDFAPDAEPAPDAESSDEESKAEEPAAIAKPQANKRKRGDEEEAEDVGFENSGDEAIMKEGTKSKRKKGKKSKEEVEDEGGEGGLVKTRSMRAQE